jgi:phage gp29-like protein
MVSFNTAIVALKDNYNKLTASRKTALIKEQTARDSSLRKEFSDHPTRGLTPSKLAGIFEQAEQGDLIAQCDLFEDMEEKDGHIAAELGKRKRALLGLNWDIKPPRNASAQEIALAANLQEIILNIKSIDDVVLNMADAIGYGYSCMEIEWLYHNDQWQPKELKHRPPRWFTVNPDEREELRIRDNSEYGAELQPLGWLVHIHKAKSGDLARGGLHRALAWPFLFKNYSVRDLAEFLEIYGLPVRIGQYPHGASEQEKATLLRAVVNMGHAAAGIIPEGMLVEFKEAAKGGSDPYQAMIDWCERTQSKCILGGTLTSQSDGKSSTNALGNVHNEVRHDLMIADAMQIGSTLSELVAMICQVNGWVTDPLRCPKFVFDTVQAEDLALLADAIPKLVDVGVPVTVAFIQEKLRLPEPEGNEPILGRAAAPMPVINAALKGEVTDQKTFTDDQQAIESLADAMPVLSPIDKAAIESAIRAATSPEDLEARLATVLSKADLTQFSQQLEKALFAADIIGYAHA